MKLILFEGHNIIQKRKAEDGLFSAFFNISPLAKRVGVGLYKKGKIFIAQCAVYVIKCDYGRKKERREKWTGIFPRK